MTKVFTAMIAVTALVVLAGCSGPRGGVVQGPVREARQGFAPDIYFESYDNERRSLRREAEPIMIVVFAASEGGDCCDLVDELVMAGAEVRPWAITIVQVTLPTSGCAFGPGCEECQIEDEDLMTLCDSRRVAWRSYNEPAVNTAFLVDDDSRIVASGGIEHLDSLVREAKVLAEEAQGRDEALYIGY